MFNFGKVGIDIHLIAIIRLKNNIPDKVLSEARKNFRDINKWVEFIFDVHYLIKMVDEPRKKYAALTLATLEDALLYVNKSVMFL